MIKNYPHLPLAEHQLQFDWMKDCFYCRNRGNEIQSYAYIYIPSIYHLFSVGRIYSSQWISIAGLVNNISEGTFKYCNVIIISTGEKSFYQNIPVLGYLAHLNW